MNNTRVLRLLFVCLIFFSSVGCKKETPAPSTIDEGLVGYINFDNNLYDQTGNGLHATAFGGSYFSISDTDYVYKLNGNGDFLKINDNPLLNFTKGMTVSLWIYPQQSTAAGGNAILVRPMKPTDDNTSYQFILGIYGSSQIWYRFFFFNLNIDDQIRPLSAFTNWSEGKWYHLTGLFLDNKVKIYVNGLLEYTFNAIGDITACSSDIYIGKNPATNATIPGYIDRLRIYDRGLTGTEVWELYQKELPAFEY